MKSLTPIYRARLTGPADFGYGFLTGRDYTSNRIRCLPSVPEETLEARLGAYATKNDKRERAVRQIFEDAGCTGDQLIEQQVNGLTAPNLICTLAGASESETIVGAYFDLQEEGNGVVDNWPRLSTIRNIA